MKSKYLILVLVTFALVSCKKYVMQDFGTGVSKELAQTRKAEISNVKYRLFFNIPRLKGRAIDAGEVVSFTVKNPTQIVLDFREDYILIKKIFVNGKPFDIQKISNYIEIDPSETNPSTLASSTKNSSTADSSTPNSSNIASSNIVSSTKNSFTETPTIINTTSENINYLPEAKSNNVVFCNEHIIIPPDMIIKGDNKVTIIFTAGNQSLNRKDSFMYTLFVPDRARTAFPCFDQPDLKAKFSLSLNVPSDWKAVSNTTLKSLGNGLNFINKSLPQILVKNIKLADTSEDKMVYNFSETKPLSTYLFSFVTGKFQKVTETFNNMSVSLYYRETDKAKIAQIPDIFKQVFSSIDWLEKYTEVPYPFAKYDLIILPGFQFGGMEHTGATLYNDTRMFLGESPTISEKLARMHLIAHETTHMWFGDLVTMKWFDDVWTKEVFANYLASKMTSKQFPKVNFKLDDLVGFYASSYSEDRTDGRTSIKQKLDNLENAGLVYNSIIYNKAPIIMGMLEKMIGQKRFREGLIKYLKEYSYSNADWNDLINILDANTDKDLKSWSDAWVNKKGRPVFKFSLDKEDGKNYITITQSDTLKRGLIWPEEIGFTFIGKNGIKKDIIINSDKSSVSVKCGMEDILHVIPNSSGDAYGIFMLDDKTSKYYLDNLLSFKDDVMRMSIIMNLYENMLAKNIDSDKFVRGLLKYLPQEDNSLIFSTALSYISTTAVHYAKGEKENVDNMLYKYIKNTFNKAELRLLAFRKLYLIETNKNISDILYKLWDNKTSFKGLNLGVYDYTKMAYELMIRFPNKYEYIKEKQAKRFVNPDRRQSFEFIVSALNPDEAVRDSCFNSLLQAENRSSEPDASSALSYLNHFLRQKSSIKYIYPALQELKEVKRTGDIFFPSSWAGSLLSGHDTKEAFDIVHKFLVDNPDYPQLLKNKILRYIKH